MAEEAQKEKDEPAQVQEMAFLQRMAKEGWSLADDYGRVVIIERPEKDVISRGYIGYNNQKKIVLSSSIEKCELEALDMLAYIKKIRADGRKPKTQNP